MKINPKITRLANLLKLAKTFVKSIISLLEFGGIKTNFKDIHFDKMCELLLKEMKNKGPKSTIKLFKSLHRLAVCVSLDHAFEKLHRRKVIKGTIIPCIIGPFLPLLRGTVWDKRFALTLFNLYKVLRLPPSDDFSAITNVGPELNEELLENFEDFIEECSNVVKSQQISSAEQYDFLGYVTSSNGPNGPLMAGNHLDAIALVRDPNLYDKVRQLLEITAPIIGNNLDRLKEKILKIDTSHLNPIHSKVSQLCEGGGKTRNIAILDYFSQSALDVIHNKVLRQLKRINSCDATFGQEDGFSKVIKKAMIRKECFSLDLTSATDRFPLTYQHAVVKAMFGKEIGDLWKSVIADRDFKIKDKTLRWAYGQPLGALSSWGVFTLTHHAFVRWCADDPKFENYMILGDDIAIMDERVAQVYSDRMKILGVDVNPNKGFMSKGENIYGEFAKRIFRNGEELTGLPIDLILACSKTLYMIPDLIGYIQRRWKVVLPGFELYAPACFSSLSRKGKSLLQLILQFRQTLEAKRNLWYPWCAEDRDIWEDVNEYYLTLYQKRIAMFHESGTIERDHLIMTKLIEPISKTQGNHVSNMVVESIKDRAHPAALLGVKLAGALAEITENIAYNLEELDKLFVEFVPDFSFRAYIYDRKTVRNITLGKTALKFYHDAIKRNKI